MGSAMTVGMTLPLLYAANVKAFHLDALMLMLLA